MKKSVLAIWIIVLVVGIILTIVGFSMKKSYEESANIRMKAYFEKLDEIEELEAENRELKRSGFGAINDRLIYLNEQSIEIAEYEAGFQIDMANEAYSESDTWTAAAIFGIVLSVASVIALVVLKKKVSE